MDETLDGLNIGRVYNSIEADTVHGTSAVQDKNSDCDVGNQGDFDFFKYK